MKTAEDRVIKMFRTAYISIHEWEVSIWSGCGKGRFATVKRQPILGELSLADDTKKAWEMAWDKIQEDLIQKLSE